MPDLRMSPEERDAFLSEVRVATVAVPADGRAPIATPVWYRYEPGGCLHFICEPSGEKGSRMQVGTAIAVSVQDFSTNLAEGYVTVEGVVEEIDVAGGRDELARLAERYYGPEGGPLYMSAIPADMTVQAVSVRPIRFLTRDYSKLGIATRG